MSISFKKSPIEFKQHQMYPSNVFDLLPDDHDCYLYSDIFKQLETASIEKQYSRRGQNAYHPRLITSILIYAYSNGIFSSRQIEKRCNEDLSFMYISEMNCPNFRVLSDFRKNNSDFFHDCFKQSVLLAMQLGLASLGHVSLDGSKFKANTSKHKAMSYKRLKEKERLLIAEIETLIDKAKKCDDEEDREYKDTTGYGIPEDLKFKEERLAKIQAAKEALEQREQELHPGKEIDDKKQISFADTDARIMGKKNGTFDYQYNAQVCADEDNQIIVAQYLSQSANDKKEVEPALNTLQETTGQLPSKMSFDNGYMSGDNLEAIEAAKLDAYVATDKCEKTSKILLDESERKLIKADFIYNKKDDFFTCPGGQKLVLIHTSKSLKKTYQGSHDVCADCKYKSRCCKSTKGHARTINTDDKEPLRQQMNEKMEKSSSKDIYKKRKVIVEPVFGQIKNIGFRRFSVRGFANASGEFSLACIAHNVKKILKAVSNGVACPEFEKMIEISA